MQSRLYRELAEKYRETNRNQSWLCYENAIFHSKKESYGTETEVFCQECREEMDILERHPEFTVVKTAIVILSYNHSDLTKGCIESIRQNNSPGSYELIVVDNASSDGIQQWLREQEDIHLLENQVNQGFPYGCNQGISLAEESSNILLLNNDTLVPDNAIFWLRMGLYLEERIGGVGSVSNQAVNYQQVSQEYETVEEWMKFARVNNMPMSHPWEKKSWLMGFAMLIKRGALNAILEREPELLQVEPIEYLDTRFSPGNFEDNDLSIRLLLAGYQLCLVKNSFIFHYGGKAFQKAPDKYRQLLIVNRGKLVEKYGIDLVSASEVESALIDMVKSENLPFQVLEVGCKLGGTLARIKSCYPQAEVLGIEENSLLSCLAKEVVPVISGNFLDDFSTSQRFDYILFDKILTSGSSKELKKAASLLKPTGKLLAVVYNSQCIKKETAEQKKIGITLQELTELCNDSNLQIQEFHYRSAVLSEGERGELVKLCGSLDSPLRPLYEGEKFIFSMSYYSGG